MRAETGPLLLSLDTLCKPAPLVPLEHWWEYVFAYEQPWRVSLKYVKDPEMPVHKVWQISWRGDVLSHAEGQCHG